MNYNEIVETLNKKRKGTFTRIAFKSEIQSAAAKKRGITVEKHSSMTIRWGVSYGKLKKIIAKKLEKSGETEKDTYKPWFKHDAQFPYIIHHLTEIEKMYLQIFVVNGKNQSNTRVRYYINNIPSTKEEAMVYCNPSTFAPKDETPVMFNIPLQNILSIQ